MATTTTTSGASSPRRTVGLGSPSTSLVHSEGNGNDPASAPSPSTQANPSTNVELEGKLKKLGSAVENWKSRYFVLDKDGVLTYYKKTKHASKGRGIKSLLLRAASECGPKMLQGPLKAPTAHCMYITYPPRSRTYYFCASSAEELNLWLSAVKRFVPNAPPQRETKGFLLKMGKINTSWKKRFFVLSNGELCYYRNFGDEFVAKPRGKLVLSASSTGFYSCPGLNAPTPHTFSLYHPPQRRMYYFCAGTADEMTKWVQSIGYYVLPSENAQR